MSARDKNDVVFEEKYVAIRPPVIKNLSREHIHQALDAYDTYVERLEEGQDIVSLCDCFDKDLRRAIIYTEGESVFESDDNLRQFLEPASKISSVTDMLKLTADVKMKMNVKEIRDRIAQYNNEFLQIILNTDLTGVKPKVTIDAYLAGVKPDVVASLAKAYTEARKVTLKDVMKFVAEKAEAESELYQASSSLKSKDKPRTPKPQTEPKTPVKSVFSIICRNSLLY